MDAKLLINAIKANNDFWAISNDAGCSIEDLKKYLIQAISSPRSGRIPDDEHDSDSDEMVLDSQEDLEEKPAAIEVVVPMEFYEESDFPPLESEDEDMDINSLLEEEEHPLSNEQLKFIKQVITDRMSVFLCAPAGYGKSEAIRFLMKVLRQKRTSNTYGICAYTGRASMLLGIEAKTLHSYLGIGLARGSPNEWAKHTRTAPYMYQVMERLSEVQTIIVDEASMISAKLIDQMDMYLQIVRGDTSPFGGVQMVLVGDMAQLGPVEGGFIFKSNCFKRNHFSKCLLTKCFRQDDPTFLSVLAEIRIGNCSDKSYDVLQQQTSIDEEYADGIIPMKIMSTNREVDNINDHELDKLCKSKGVQPKVFEIRNTGNNKKKATAYRKKMGIPESVSLAIGCQIVITQNSMTNKAIVNGSQGVITSLSDNNIGISLLNIGHADIRYVKFKDPEVQNMFKAETLFEFMPLRLSYASTVHRIQGMTLQVVDVDLNKTFCHGQAYVAISRCTTLNGLIVRGLSKKAFICDGDVKRYIVQ